MDAHVVGHRASEVELQPDTLRAMARPESAQSGQAEKEVSPRKEKVLLEDAISIQGVLRVRKQCLVRAEAGEDDLAGGNVTDHAIAFQANIAQVLGQPQVERHGVVVTAAQVEVQPFAVVGAWRILAQGGHVHPHR
ncbi:hypothetical protein D3C80_1703010 [compost metagenome]